ncbi:MAG TPA: hypothetical protein VHG28_15170 [Longimicrobiaceae bacterium]|nr:hypothetical protein [Longimicrobiaceae bacterium]
MANKLILLQIGDSEVPVAVGASIRREELYGRQTRTVEKDGLVLEKVVLDPEGNVFIPADIAHLPTDGQGSLTTPPLVQTEDGEPLPQRLSSFKEKRTLRPAGLADVARLRVDAVFPVACDLPPGFYCTEFTYRDAPVLKAAVLNVTSDGAFLLTGAFIETPLQGQADVYSFFDEDEDPDDEDPEEISFEMF